MNLARTAAIAVVAALVTVVASITLAVWVLGLSGKLSQSTGPVLDLVKLAFALVAGVGGTVGLVLAYRRHQITEEANLRDRAKEERELARLYNERFESAAGQLGSDRYAVRLAGVYAMAGLADDWPGGRQMCIDVLCAGLRQKYGPDPGDEADIADRLAFMEGREFRHTTINAVTTRLRTGARVSWQGHDFDFSGVVFDGGHFHGAVFSGGRTSFYQATFSAGDTNFAQASFTGGDVNFFAATFAGGLVNFHQAVFASDVRFDGARFTGASVYFRNANFTGGTIDFTSARFTGGHVQFNGAQFDGGTVNFAKVSDWGKPPTFDFELADPPAGVQLPVSGSRP